MATLRPAKCYKRLKRPNTRVSVRKPKKGYVKGVPGSKIQRFEMGDRKTKFPKVYHLVSKNDVQIRSNSLEAARVTATRYLVKVIY
jgi:large subunit ribosomal protein L10e